MISVNDVLKIIDYRQKDDLLEKIRKVIHSF